MTSSEHTPTVSDATKRACQPGYSLNHADGLCYTAEQGQSLIEVVLFLLLYGIVMLASVMGNLLLVVVTVLNPRLRGLSDWLLVNMSVVHLTLTFFIVPFYLHLLLNKNQFMLGEHACRFWVFADLWLQMCEYYTLGLILLDVYFSNMHVACYKRWLTPCTLILAVVMAWLVAAATAICVAPKTVVAESYSCVVRQWEYLLGEAIVHITLPFINIIIYLLVVYRIRRTVLRPTRGMSIFAGKNEYGDFCGIFNPDESKVLRMLGITTSALMVCGQPIHLFTVITFSLNLTYPLYVCLLLHWVRYVSTVVIPITNFTNNWKFRLAMKKVLCKRRLTAMIQVEDLRTHIGPTIGLTTFFRVIHNFARYTPPNGGHDETRPKHSISEFSSSSAGESVKISDDSSTLDAVTEVCHDDAGVSLDLHDDACVSLDLHDDAGVSLDLHDDAGVSLDLHDDAGVSIDLTGPSHEGTETRHGNEGVSSDRPTAA